MNGYNSLLLQLAILSFYHKTFEIVINEEDNWFRITERIKEEKNILKKRSIILYYPSGKFLKPGRILDLEEL